MEQNENPTSERRALISQISQGSDMYRIPGPAVFRGVNPETLLVHTGPDVRSVLAQRNIWDWR